MNEWTRKRSAKTLYLRLLRLARPFWGHVVGILLLSVLAVPLTLLFPIPLMIAVDSAIGSEPLPRVFGLLGLPTAEAAPRTALVLAVVLVVLLALATQLLAMLTSLLSVSTSERLTLGLRAKLFPHVQRLSPAFHDKRGTSDSIYRILYDTAAVPSIVIDGIIPFVIAGLTLTGMMVVTFWLNWRLALVALVVAPMILLVAVGFSRRLRREWEEGKRIAASLQGMLQEVLGSLRVVIAFGREGQERDRLMGLADEGVRTHVRIAFIKSLMELLVGVVAAAGLGAIIYIGIREVQNGTVTLGEFLVVMTYLTQLNGPLQTVSRKLGDVQASLVSVDRALSLLDEIPDVVERPNARPLQRLQGRVAFENVSFGYDAGHPVLEGVSFEVEPGTRVGIVGETGAGKSTLVNLLTRFYDPTAGRILLDGVDSRDFRLADLRDQFAIVLQDPVLFSGSIAENIAYGRPAASEAEILEAARMAGAYDFVSTLPEGLATRVGERGHRLSGGERQRIGLARAFLKDAPILILDEPTSSIDVRTERIIMDAMARLMAGRTTFLIAHRPSTLEHCDRLLIIENGRLAGVTAMDSPLARQALLLEHAAEPS